MIVPIILAGGTGSRLWPLSREAYPKQFIPVLTGESLFQRTLARVVAWGEVREPIVVGNEQHRFLMAEQIRESMCPQSVLLLEPCFRGTAPAVAWAAWEALASQGEEVILLVLPADHMIHNERAFHETLQAGWQGAKQGKLVTLGVVPTRPETGYGYIERGECLPDGISYAVKRFVEKPAMEVAKIYCDSGQFFWNSGMFMFSAAVFLEELVRWAPEIYENTRLAYEGARRNERMVMAARGAFEACPLDSIDYAVMEKTDKGIVVPLRSDWSDVGAWDAWVELFDRSVEGNVNCGEVVVQACKNNYIHADHRLVVALGMENTIIVETADAVLVMDRARAQEVKSVVALLKAQNRKEVVFHRRVDRPWGVFESVDQGARFQVKRITVALGGRLSLQRHRHRSEHWVVVQGKARVTRGEEEFILEENQSTYIPMGVVHRLENAGEIPLEIIEVQSGDYLGEDDIERLEDHYGRLEKMTV